MHALNQNKFRTDMKNDGQIRMQTSSDLVATITSNTSLSENILGRAW